MEQDLVLGEILAHGETKPTALSVDVLATLQPWQVRGTLLHLSQKPMAKVKAVHLEGMWDQNKKLQHEKMANFDQNLQFSA